MIHLRVYNHHYANDHRMNDANEQILRVVLFIDQLNDENTFAGEAKVIVKASPEKEMIEIAAYSKNEMLKRYLNNRLLSFLKEKKPVL
ncbi:hypothetical protein [Fulvivirga kasyanovii]|uniref:Uncharacterized protein n=1 Tax=Fulvivirga kasyanovii TaxID=396812 RepID=A0ABW9RJT7_9BACT|nr:hypothetical protein [Fulvivirga kasyanovii]MTI24347.1 hypothetical protein [Fulvivirga kasyanovii]